MSTNDSIVDSTSRRQGLNELRDQRQQKKAIENWGKSSYKRDKEVATISEKENSRRPENAGGEEVTNEQWKKERESAH